MISTLQRATALIKNTLEIVKETAIKENIIELREVIYSLQETVFSLQNDKASLIESIKELKAKIVEYENWEKIASNYDLAEIASGVFAYSSKSEVGLTEPLHRICQNCFQKKKKSILQRTRFEATGTYYKCFECGTEICDHSNKKVLKPSRDKRKGGMVV